MPEANEKRVARKARYRALGLCFVSGKHGPAVAYGLCEICAVGHRAKQKRHYAQAKERGICVNAPSHGPATNGRLCAACFASRRAEDRRRKGRVKPLCVFGAAHGPAIEGPWCAACAKRRSLAAQRLAARARFAPRDAIAGVKTAESNDIATLKSHIKRVGTMDSSGLLDCLLFNK
jgi:hypothetical protein